MNTLLISYIWDFLSQLYISLTEYLFTHLCNSCNVNYFLVCWILLCKKGGRWIFLNYCFLNWMNSLISKSKETSWSSHVVITFLSLRSYSFFSSHHLVLFNTSTAGWLGAFKYHPILFSIPFPTQSTFIENYNHRKTWNWSSKL